jgi:ABC-type proline/glycine betaine transport system permease subunit
MPAVMLFRVGDFTAMIAVVAYAVAPAIRYTALACATRRSGADRGGAGHGLHAAWQI